MKVLDGARVTRKTLKQEMENENQKSQITTISLFTLTLNT